MVEKKKKSRCLKNQKAPAATSRSLRGNTEHPKVTSVDSIQTTHLITLFSRLAIAALVAQLRGVQHLSRYAGESQGPEERLLPLLVGGRDLPRGKS